MASRGEDNDHAQDGNVQSHRRKAVGSLRAQNTFRTGKSIGQREARERAKLRRQAAVELLRNGNTALEVDEVLGMSPGWCYSAAAHHPSVRRALMGEEAAE